MDEISTVHESEAFFQAPRGAREGAEEVSVHS